MEQITEESLKEYTIPELKAFGAELGLDIKDGKKADIIEYILDNYQDAEPLEDNLDEAATDEDSIDQETAEADNTPEQVVEENTNVQETLSIQKDEELPSTITIQKAKLLYSDTARKKPIAKVVGFATVLGQEGAFYHIKIHLSGKGLLTGYIDK